MARDAEADEPERISQLLTDWANRDPAAREQLVPIVYEELRRLAHHYMRGERSGHTLQTTALVNEAYCAWPESMPCSGATARTFSRWPRRSCAASWWITPVSAHATSAAPVFP